MPVPCFSNREQEFYDPQNLQKNAEQTFSEIYKEREFDMSSSEHSDRFQSFFLGYVQAHYKALYNRAVAGVGVF